MWCGLVRLSFEASVYLGAMPTANLSDLGYVIEGVVEQDPMDERCRIRTIQNGKQVLVDPQDLLSKYGGQTVRLTVSSLEAIQKLQDLLEESGGMPSFDGSVMLQDLPGTTITRKPD
jgi:hypothetical protein